MKKYISVLSLLFCQAILHAQDLHFSQYNNAPLLLNPANTGLLQDGDWRAGTNYRNQGATIPVPYNTFSVFADFGLFRNKWETSWLGTGIALWRDVAGNGNLALTKVQTNLAYHLLINDNTSISTGLSASYNQRSVDFSKLTFDVQWDEFSFNKSLANGETNSTQKTSFVDLNAGMNIAYYNNNNFYVKASVAAAHVNMPVESFYGESNKIGIRPLLNLEVTYKASTNVIINPSVYYTKQKKASELVGGAMFNINVGENLVAGNNEFMVGAFYRNKDAVIVAAGYKFRQHKFTVSYDHTVSDLAQGNNGIGAFEVSLLLQGNYRKDDAVKNTYGCPRF